MRDRLAPRAAALLVSVVAAFALAVSNAGGTTLTPALSCASGVLGQPFLRWLDPAYYALVPDGAIEESPTRWTLTGGAQRVAGNERYYVHSAADTTSLRLPEDSTATTEAMCVRTGDPTLRFFARNSQSFLSTLRVEVIYTDVFGTTRVANVARVSGTNSWQPTATLPFLVNVTSLQIAEDGTTAVAFRFTARGDDGWRIDDVYVDPFKGT